MEHKENFGKYIRQKRLDAGLSQKELAKELFVSESAVSKWERGLSYPDMTLVTSLCQLLHISEHELLTASDDMHQREIEIQSRGYLRIIRNYTWITYICYLAVLVPCFIGNLATEHRLSWFFIVIGGLALPFSFLNIPLMAKSRRAEKCFWFFYGSLIYLLCTCRIVLGGDWLIMALLGISLGLLGIFLPIILYQYPENSFVKRHNGLICMGIDTVLIYLMVFFGYLFYTTEFASVQMKNDFGILTLCAVLAWIIFFIFYFAKKYSRLLKTGLTIAICGVWVLIANGISNMFYAGDVLPKHTIDFLDWETCASENVGLLALIVGAVICVVSIIKAKRNSLR